MTDGDGQALTAEALAALIEDRTGVDLLIDDSTSRWCAAIGATLMLWRNGPLEDVHADMGKAGGITDPEMMRANVITTRHVAAALLARGCDWRQLAIELTDAGRPIGEVALSEFVGTANVEMLRRHALDQAAWLDVLAARGWEWLRTFLGCSGARSDWFGVPWWPEHIEVFVSDVIDPDSRLSRLHPARAAMLAERPLRLPELADALVTSPELLSAEALAWCVRVGIGYMDRQAVMGRWQAAGRPRWAPT